MSTTLLQMIVGNPAGNVGTSGTIRYYADKDFTASDGTKYKGGQVGSKDYFLSNTWSVSGGLLTVPTKTGFPTTTDAQPTNARITAAIYDSKRIYRGNLFENFRIPANQPTPLSLLYLQTFNVTPQPVRSVETLTKDEFALMLAEAIEPADTANVGVLGRIETATTPADPAHPKAVLHDDPRIGNALQIQGVDVDDDAPTNGQGLIYDSILDKWKPGSVSGESFGAVNVTDYGADNTGATSPYAGIAAAITAMLAVGARKLYMPAGTYDFEQADFTAHSILIDFLSNNNVEVFGDGMGKTNITMPASINKRASTGNRIIGGFGSNCWVHDLTITGPDGVNNVVVPFIGIFGGGGTSVRNTVERVEITNFNDQFLTAGALMISVGDGGLQTIINTTLGTVIAAGLRTVTPASMAGIYAGAALRIGGTTEDVIVVETTPTTFTATFAQAHGASDTVIGTDEGFTRVKIKDCYLHDSRKATAIDLTSNGNWVTGNKVIGIGTPGTQHGIYMSGGHNYVGHNEFRGISGFFDHQYPANGNMDLAGNRFDHNLVVGGGMVGGSAGGGVTIINSTANGNNPRMPVGVSIQRYTIFTGNVFLDAGLTSEVPVILKGNNWWIDTGVTVSVQYPPNSLVGTDNFVNGRVLGNPFNDSNRPGAGASISLGTLINDNGGQPNLLSIQAESGWAGAASAGASTGWGGNLYLLPGNGRRLFRVITNLAGAVAVTVKADPVQSFTSGVTSPRSITYTSGVDFTLGTDDTPTQLAVTATNLAAAIDNTGGYGVARIVAARASGADVRIIPQSGQSVILSTNQAARIDAINGVDGANIVGGAHAYASNTPAQITANQDNYNPGQYYFYQRWSTDASRNITGLLFSDVFRVNPDNLIEGVTLMIVNVGAQNIVLVNESASSDPPNRFHNTTGADITLAPDQEARCWHDFATNRWRCSKMN